MRSLCRFDVVSPIARFGKLSSRYRHGFVKKADAREAIKKLPTELELARPIIQTPVIKEKRALIRMQKMKNFISINDVQMYNHEFTPIIRCRVGQYNHFKGQIYGKRGEKCGSRMVLASEHWNNHSTTGDYFSIYPTTRPAYENDMPNSSFADFIQPPLDSRLIKRLNSCGFTETSFVQFESIPRLLNGGHHLVVSDTGSGKTLVYLVALLHQAMYVRSVEQEYANDPTRNYEKRKPFSPLAIIVVPSRELAAQVYEMALRLIGSPPPVSGDGDVTDSFLDVTCRMLSSARSREYLASSQGRVDILIGSPGTLTHALNERRLNIRHVNHVVLDEADSLLDDTFAMTTTSILNQAFKQLDPLRRVQLTMISATMPTDLGGRLDSVINVDHELEKIVTKRVHSVPSHIKQTFIRTPVLVKSEFLLDVLTKCGRRGTERSGKDGPIYIPRRVDRVIVFCNKSATAAFVCKLLTAHNYQAYEFHREVELKQRLSNLNMFTASTVRTCPSSPMTGPSVLCCTDLASRGLDTVSTDVVINYDFPLNMADYIHRVGRVGRIGSPSDSQVISFVGGYIPVELTQKIETAVRTQTELPKVDANIIKVIRSRAEIKLAASKSQ